MEQVSGNLTLKGHCNYIIGFCSPTTIIATKPIHDNLPLSTISYPYQQLVTLITKKIEMGNLKTLIAIVSKKISYPLSTISYPLSTISYPYQQLVTLYQQLVTLSSTISYLSSTISYPRCSTDTIPKVKTITTLKLLKFFIKLVLKSKGKRCGK